MIEELTQEQRDMLDVYRDKWIAVGVETKATDFDAAVELVPEIYEAAGLKPPKHFWLADSPVSAAMLAATLQNSGALYGDVVPRPKSKVTDKPTLAMWQRVRASACRSINEERVGCENGDPITRFIAEPIELATFESALVKNRDRLASCIDDMAYGSHDAGWLASYDYFYEVLKLDCAKPLRGLVKLAHVCGWWAPYANGVIFQHRHSKLERDAAFRLHCETGKAVEYPDGFGLYMWHGVQVPRYVVEEPEMITVKDILDDANAEVRRIKIERYGFDRFVVDGKIETVHTSTDQFGHKMTLHKKAMSGNEPALTFLKVVNSTPEPDGSYKTYVLPVHSTVKTCEEARASTFGMRAEEFNPEQET